MANTLIIRDALKDLIGAKATTYYVEAPEDAIYPYAVFDFGRTVSDGIDRYQLEINVWDEYKTYSRVDTLMDDIEKHIDREKIINEAGAIIIHKDNIRDHVPDENKAIKRTRSLFILDVTERR